MKFYTDGSIFKAISISGPTHNYLGLGFSNDASNEVAVDAISLNDGEPQKLDVARVRRLVEHGVDEANRNLAASYRLKLIQFILSDSPPEEIYYELAARIVERMHGGLGFSGEDKTQ